MTVSSTTRITTPFIGTGVLVPTFPFAFKVFVNTDILAVINYNGAQTTLTLTSDYSVALNSDQDGSPGGTITLNTLSNTPGIVGGNLAVGATMVISSQVPQLQSNTLTNFGGFFPTVINAMVDRLTILVQQLALTISRGLTFPITDSSSLITQLPPAAARANLLVGFDALGNVIASPGIVGPQGAQGIPGSTYAGVNLNYYTYSGGL